jgi:hypothetical protein
MRGFTADISDQTCKTAAQSGTRFVGHRQLPWIHSNAPVSLRLSAGVIPGRAKARTRNLDVASLHHLEIPDQSADADCPE